MDRHGVYGLQRNLLVENIIDAYKQEVEESNAARWVGSSSATRKDLRIKKNTLLSFLQEICKLKPAKVILVTLTAH